MQDFDFEFEMSVHGSLQPLIERNAIAENGAANLSSLKY